MLDDNAFPSDFYRQNPTLLLALRSVGLKSMMNFDTVLMVARRIEQSGPDDMVEATVRAVELIR